MTRPKQKKTIAPATVALLMLAAAAAVAFIDFDKASPKQNTDSEVYNTISTESLQKVILPGNTPNQDISYTGFTVGFNLTMHQPNYVAWELTPEKADGDNTRKDADFAPDTNIEGCATLADYRKSGFDRGHMAPAADMKWSADAMRDCHYLTNISPQEKSLNTGAWATVEKNARKWVQQWGRLIIVAGPILNDRLTRTIGQTPIPVPERFYKVIIAPDANPPMGIGFIMPNSYVEGGAQATTATIDQVEAATGIDFFAALPDSIETIVESQNTLYKWNR